MNQTIRLPLHPRKAQEIFWEILQVEAHQTPALTVATPLPQRLQTLQLQYLDALQQIKSKNQWTTAAHEMVTWQLVDQGSSLSWQLEGVTHSIALRHIQKLELNPSSPLALRLKVHPNETNDPETHDPKEPVHWMAADATTLRAWVLVLMCGVTSFQHATKSGPQNKALDLIWQAARVRLVELMDVMPLHSIISTIQNAIQRHQQDDMKENLVDALLLQVI